RAAAVVSLCPGGSLPAGTGSSAGSSDGSSDGGSDGTDGAGGSVPCAPGTVTILDDSEAGFTMPADWNVEDPEADTYLSKQKWTDEKNVSVGEGVWEFTGLAPGQYEVSVTYLEASKNNNFATYSVWDDTRQVSSPVVINQEIAPSPDHTESGRPFQTLFPSAVTTSGTLHIKLSSNYGTGSIADDTIFDAIRIECVGSAPCQPVVIHPNLIARYSFDDPADAGLDDSPYGRAAWVLGPDQLDDVDHCKIVSFIDAADYINLDPAIFNWEDRLTISFWARRYGMGDANRGHTVLGLGQEYWWSHYSPTGLWNPMTLFFDFLFGPDVIGIHDRDCRIYNQAPGLDTHTSDDTWHHYAYVRNGPDNSFKYYMDGVLSFSGTYQNGGVTTECDPSWRPGGYEYMGVWGLAYVGIGRDYDSACDCYETTDRFIGKMDDFQV
ncbi:MAG: LamG domain-containing protein, partial [Planctomycetales bacterium]